MKYCEVNSCFPCFSYINQSLRLHFSISNGLSVTVNHSNILSVNDNEQTYERTNERMAAQMDVRTK